MTTRTELLKRAPRTVLPRAGQRVLCAVSGGLDSMCLLHMLEAWREERGGQVAAAHFNHRLRGAALAFWGHRANIKRLLHKEERKTYLSKKSEE